MYQNTGDDYYKLTSSCNCKSGDNRQEKHLDRSPNNLTVYSTILMHFYTINKSRSFHSGLWIVANTYIYRCHWYELELQKHFIMMSLNTSSQRWDIVSMFILWLGWLFPLFFNHIVNYHSFNILYSQNLFIEK